MPPDVTVIRAAPRTLAAVRRSVRIPEIAAAWKPALDQVWAFLARNPTLRDGGHNVFLYHHPTRRDDPMDVDFGVEVVRAFEADGSVRAVATPEGEAARAMHVGPYHQLGRTHEAIHAWAKANGRAVGGASWEVYGDWSDDPRKLETEVVYLLR